MSEIADVNLVPPSRGWLSRVGDLSWALVLGLAVTVAGVCVAGGLGYALASLWTTLDPELSADSPAYQALATSSLYFALAPLSVVGVYSVLVRLIERRERTELAPAGAWGEAARGAGLAVAGFSLLMGGLTLLGAVEWGLPSLADWRSAAPERLISGVFGGVLLAVVVQGAFTRVFVKALGPVGGVGLTAALMLLLPWFAGPLLLGQRLGDALGGAILALIWLRSERLWLGMGLAATWGALTNIMMGGYHLEGGYDGTEAFIHEPERGPLVSWLRGDYGPESSMALVIGGVLVVAWLARRAWKEGCFSKG